MAHLHAGVRSTDLPASDRIEWVTDEDRLSALAPAWDRLSRSHDGTPFTRPAWFQCWWRAFGGGRELRVCAAWRGDTLIGLLPLNRTGTSLQGPHVEVPLFRPLVADSTALRALAGAAVDTVGDALVIPSLPQGDPAVDALMEAARGRLTLAEPVHVSPIVETAGDVARFRELTKPRWGYPLDRLRRKMHRDHGAEFLLVDRPQDLDGMLRRGFEVESSGWKGSAGTGILSTPEKELFWRSLAETFDRTNETRLSAITLDGRMAAFDLTLLVNERLYLLKTGYDESFARLRPGLVLRLAVVERCFELGLDAHELLGHRSAWKAMFATTERHHVQVSSYARRPWQAARYLYGRTRPHLLRAYRATRSTLERSTGRRAGHA